MRKSCGAGPSRTGASARPGGWPGRPARPGQRPGRDPGRPGGWRWSSGAGSGQVRSTMSASEPAGAGRVISGDAVADFSHLTSPGELAAIGRIQEVGTVIVPQSLAAAYARIPTSEIGATVFVPDGANVRVHTGSLTVGGDGLGAADDVLVVIGMLVITSPVTGPVPQRIYVIGLVLAPRGSEPVLGPALAGGTGGVSYYLPRDDQDVKVL